MADRNRLPSAREVLEHLREALAKGQLYLFLDYDGTLTPIVERPEDAVLAPAMRSRLAELAERCFLAIVSGRGRADLTARVGIEGIAYAGSHGLELVPPDGSTKELPDGSTVADLAAAIGPGLAKAAVASVVDGEVRDLMYELEDGQQVRILTERDDESLPVLRHSAAHVLATAVRELRPEANIGFGPPIDEGFYYDFEVDEPFTPEELETFEAKMREVTGEAQRFERRVVDREEARELFADDPLKLERLDEFDDDEVITVYRNGPFLDLCRGPHVPTTGRLVAVRRIDPGAARRAGITSWQQWYRRDHGQGTSNAPRLAHDGHDDQPADSQ